MEGIMVSAATGVMNSLLDKLTSLLDKTNKLHKGVKRDIRYLRHELGSMNTLLEKLAEKEELERQHDEWRSQVRELSYDIEDRIDEYIHLLQQDPGESNGIKGFFRKMIQKVKKWGACHEIAEQIKELKTEIVEVSPRRERYKFDEVVSSGSTSVVHSFAPVTAWHQGILVGIDDTRDDLIKLVTDEEQQLKVVSIVGFGGMGKTTLAAQVYKNLGGKFECQGFVSMSRNPDMRKILRYILFQTKQIKKQEEGDMESCDQLINELREFLKDKRYFVVIDDIWNDRDWEVIKCALPDGKRGSRIMTTTRNDSVANSCSITPHDWVHKISCLSDDDAKSLFFKRAFGHENSCPRLLKDVSIEIVARCCGSPLKIITLSSLLHNRRTREEWITVRDSMGRGTGLQDDPAMNVMNKILSLSYIDLPYNLQSCMLYLSIFPEDYTIKRDQLVRRWIAEGFIKAEGVKSLEEGECYFNELINRGLIQPTGIKYNGQVIACRVHDMILDVIRSKAYKENFVTLGNHTDADSSRKVRRLSLDCRDQESTTVLSMDLSHARSLSIFGDHKRVPPFSNFKALRVVDIESELESNHLWNIGQLLQLRYLRLSASTITKLPENICQLQFLETLDLVETGITKLPASIVGLQKLKCLIVQNVILPAGIGNLQSLRELSQILVDESCSVNSLVELGSLTNLRVLHLLWCISDSHSEKIIYANKLVSSLCKLGTSNLRSLRVGSEYRSLEFMFDSWSLPPDLLGELILYPNYFCKVPEWLASLANLTYIEIGVNSVTQEVLEIFGNLPVLQFLELSSKAIVPTGLIIRSGTFRCLEVFRLYCPDIENRLMFEAGAMENIKTLLLPIRAHEAQSTFGPSDFSIHHLSNVQHLVVRISCRGAEDWEVMALEDVIRDAASKLRNKPLPHFRKYYMKEMINYDREKKSTAQDIGNLLYSVECHGCMDDHMDRVHIIHYPYCLPPLYIEEEPNSCTIC